VLGQVVPLALDWDGHPRSSAGVGLVGEDLQAGGGRPGEDLVAAGGSEIVGRAGVAGSDPQQLSIAVGERREGDRVVAVLAAPVPADVLGPGPGGSSPVMDAVDLAAGAVE